MAGHWKTTATVKPGGVIELVVPDLPAGEEVEIDIRQNGSAAAPAGAMRPGFGADRGTIFMSDDFDAPLGVFQG